MAKSKWTILYEKIKNAKTPTWLKTLLEKIVKPILQGIGDYAMTEIKRKVIEASTHDDWTNEEKFHWVFDEITAMYNNIGENALGIAIKVSLEELKKKKLV